MTLGEKKNRSPSPMTTTDSRQLKRLAFTRPARLDFGLPLATPSHKQSCKSGRGEAFKRKKFNEPESKNEIRFQKLRSAQRARERSRPSFGTGRTLSYTSPHGESRGSASLGILSLKQCQRPTRCHCFRLRSLFGLSSKQTAGRHRLL